MATSIHASAIVDPKAELADGVVVGPYAIIGARVRIGAGTRVGAHCVIDGVTTIGADNVFHPHSSIGGPPQDKKYAGEPTELSIGDRNTVREFCTFNTGTAQDGGVTRVGSDNWVMAYVHLAHDVQLGDRCILANNATLAGHVHVGDWVIVGGLSGVHQFVKIGAHAMIGFSSAISQDVPPFMMVDGNPPHVAGFNVEGLRRRGFTPERVAQVKQMHRLLYRNGLTFQESKAEMNALRGSQAAGNADLDLMLDFLNAAQRGIVR